MEIGRGSFVPAMKPAPPPPPPPEAQTFEATAAVRQAIPAFKPFVPEVLPPAHESLGEALEAGLALIEDATADVPAMMEVFANRKLERAALAGVAPDLRETYGAIGETLEEAPRAHLAVQLDLLRGELPKNALVTGFIPGAGEGAKGGFGAGALDYLKNKVADLGKYVEKKLGMAWEEQPQVTKPLTDAEVAGKLGADPAFGLKAQAALDALPPEDKARFERVAKALESDQGAFKRLEALLVEGKLTGAKDLKGGASLLANLDALAAQPLAPELAGKRATLLADTLREIHDPSTVDQKHRNTCGAATVQSYLAATNPGDYVRLVAGLASPAGEVEMRDGGKLKRDANFMDGTDNGRTLTSRLLQPAIMNRASIGTYDNKADGTPIPGLDAAIPGMFPAGMARVMTELTGEGRKTVWNTPGFDNHAYEGGTKAKPIPVLVNYPGGGPDLADKVGPHWISVTGVDKAKGTVTYRNPWGQEETVSQKEFDRHVYAVVAPSKTGSDLLDAITA